jgi:hypothetical protein
MSGAILLWVTSKIAFIGSTIAWLLGGVTGLMNNTLRFIESLPYAKITLPYIDALAAWCVALCIILAIVIIVNKRRSSIYMFLAMFVATVAWMFHLHADEHKDYILFYNSSKFAAVQLVATRDTTYLFSNIERDDADIDYIVSPYLRRSAMDEPLWLFGDYEDKNITSRNGLVDFRGLRMKMLCDRSWQQDSVPTPVDVLLLCKGFKGAMDAVLEKYPTERIIMDAGLHAMSRRRVAKECALLDVCCMDISQLGAVRLSCVDKKTEPCNERRQPLFGE